MMQSRQQVLDYIARNRMVTVGEISHALNMTENNVKHHLKILQENGIVEEMGHLPPRGRGRPANIYALSNQTKAHSLDHLAQALFAEIKKLSTPERQPDILNDIAKALIRQLDETDGPALKDTSHLTQRLIQAMDHLNQLRYQARWEARSTGAHIIFYHCPFASILTEFPELCHIDKFMLQNLLDINLEQIAKLAPDTRGVPHCIFRLIKPIKVSNP